MQNSSCLSRQQGFTFNEILVTMVIAGIGVLCYTASTLSVIHGNRTSYNWTAAVNLAQDKMEELRGRAVLTNENLCPAAESGINVRGVAPGIFARCWKIFDSAIGTNLKQIEVAVAWREVKAQSVTLVTLVYQD
jgi:prepilin-type N-terminal cleavage/methylation domain-containing protein